MGLDAIAFKDGHLGPRALLEEVVRRRQRGVDERRQGRPEGEAGMRKSSGSRRRSWRCR